MGRPCTCLSPTNVLVRKNEGDYSQMAEGMGATGLVVKQPYEMADALQEAQKLNFNGKTVLIDVHSNMETQRSRL